jgi:hypothetical protein
VLVDGGANGLWSARSDVTSEVKIVVDFFPRCRTAREMSENILRRYFVTTNWGLLLSVPVGVTTETIPVVAPAGTVAEM